MMPSALGTSQSLSMLEGLLTALSLNEPIQPASAAPYVIDEEKSEPNRSAIRESMKNNLDALCKWMYAQIHQFRLDTMKSIDRILDPVHIQDSLILDHQRTFERNLKKIKAQIKEHLQISPLRLDHIELDGPIAISKDSTDANRKYEGILIHLMIRLCIIITSQLVQQPCPCARFM